MHASAVGSAARCIGFDAPNYLAVIASHGYTVANIEYTVAPEAKYPGSPSCPARRAS